MVDETQPDAQYIAALKAYSEAVEALRDLRGADLYAALERAHEAHLELRARLEESPGVVNAGASDSDRSRRLASFAR